ncbi:sodium:sulfate symporter [Campylobacter jejuni]
MAVIMAVILQVMPLGPVCIAIAIVALSGITTTQLKI